MFQAGLGLFALCGAAFPLTGRRAGNAMLPLPLFRRPAFCGATTVGLPLTIGFYGQLSVVTFSFSSFQQYRHYAVLWAGLALLPQTAMTGVASALGGRMTARTGPRTPMAPGLLVGAAGFPALLVAGRSTPYWYWCRP
ncbi:hypothetical protein ACFOOM_19435 [Streptomyces echinoruber]|uniref:Major facilitator superfamily (MFS) profile domain-containing protein n=1 Tax=Streptomyces echinoruber TaxID=68898 RepID=A0A918RKK7_9ACTN|nr:hypothetical protein [Streptomyces echinoruber]GHA00124.1 hypothetical protein GCM10010389_44040 [Streptomyces echinoruber]